MEQARLFHTLYFFLYLRILAFIRGLIYSIFWVLDFDLVLFHRATQRVRPYKIGSVIYGLLYGTGMPVPYIIFFLYLRIFALIRGLIYPVYFSL